MEKKKKKKSKEDVQEKPMYVLRSAPPARPGVAMGQVDLLESRYVVCFTLCGAVNSLVALVSFLLHFPHVYPADPLCSLRRGQPSICQLPWLQSITSFSEAKVCCPVQRSPDGEYFESLLLTV